MCELRLKQKKLYINTAYWLVKLSSPGDNNYETAVHNCHVTFCFIIYFIFSSFSLLIMSFCLNWIYAFKDFFMTYFLLNILVFAVGLTIYNLFYQNLLLVYANLITVICVMYNCHSFITIPFALLFCAIVVIHNKFIYVKIQQVVFFITLYYLSFPHSFYIFVPQFLYDFLLLC